MMFYEPVDSIEKMFDGLEIFKKYQDGIYKWCTYILEDIDILEQKLPGANESEKELLEKEIEGRKAFIRDLIYKNYLLSYFDDETLEKIGYYFNTKEDKKYVKSK